MPYLSIKASNEAQSWGDWRLQLFCPSCWLVGYCCVVDIESTVAGFFIGGMKYNPDFCVEFLNTLRWWGTKDIYTLRPNSMLTSWLLIRTLSSNDGSGLVLKHCSLLMWNITSHIPRVLLPGEVSLNVHWALRLKRYDGSCWIWDILLHKSDSNQGTDHIAIFSLFSFGFPEHKPKI